MNFDSMEARLRKAMADPIRCMVTAFMVIGALGLLLFVVGLFGQSTGCFGAGILLTAVGSLGAAITSSFLPAKPSAPPKTFTLDSYVCPNPSCGHVGPVHKRDRGSAMVILLLLLCGIIPGLLAMMVYGGYDLLCPKCGVVITKR